MHASAVICVATGCGNLHHGRWTFLNCVNMSHVWICVNMCGNRQYASSQVMADGPSLTAPSTRAATTVA